MEISKSTPYVRYRENISSSLHKGTVHIESEYLDRERKTTIESIEGQTWQNVVVQENKEEDLLPRLVLAVDGNTDIIDTKEERMPIDVIHGFTEPVANEDGTYTYEVSTMEGSYAQTYDGVNNIVSSSDGLEAQMSVTYATNDDNISSSISMDNGESNYTITDSYNGEIKSAILKGQTLVNLIDFNEIKKVEGEASYEDGVITYNANSKWTGITFNLPTVKNSTVYTVVIDVLENTLSSNEYQVIGCFTGVTNIFNKGFGIHKFTITSWDDVTSTMSIVWKLQNVVASGVFKFKLMIIEGDHTNEVIPYFEGMQSIKMPVLMTSNEDSTKTNILTVNEDVTLRSNGSVYDELDLLTGKLTQRIDENGEVLSQEIVKTVVLTIKNQDGKLVPKLSTYPTTTHINLSSDGLIPSADISYTLLKSTGEASGTSIQFDNGKASDLISGVVYGESLVNALPSPSLKNSMENTSMQKLNNGYDNINVVDGDVKGATIYGDTLVNHLANYNNSDGVCRATINNHFEKDKKYFIRIVSNPYTITNRTIVVSGATYMYVGFTINAPFTNTEDRKYNQVILDLQKSDGSKPTASEINDNVKILILDYQEGMENWDIPYFEGMQSVKMPSLMTSDKRFTILPYEIFENSTPINYQAYTRIDFGLTLTDVTCSIKLNNDMRFKILINGFEEVATDSGISKGVEYSKKLNSISYIAFYNWDDIKFGNGKETILSMLKNGELEIIFSKDRENMYPHYSSQTKSNTLTTPEDVTLRKIGDVQDELNLSTGKLTQRIREIVLDGTNNMKFEVTERDNTVLAFKGWTGFKDFNCILCDKLPTKDNGEQNLDTVGVCNGINDFRLSISKIEYGNRPYTSEGLNEYFRDNNIKLIYIKSQETTKTIDISITNQDGATQPKLQSYANGYINVQSQGLLPSVNYEVPTNNSYYLDMVKPNTQYTSKGSSDCNATIDGNTIPLSGNGIFTTPSTITDKLMVLDAQVDDLMFIEGDLTGRNIDYFTGLQSVDTPVLYTVGKNLFDGEMVQGYIGDSSGIVNNSSGGGISSANFTPVKPNTKYKLSLSDNPSQGIISFYFYDKYKKYIGHTGQNTIFTTGNNVAYVKFRVYKASGGVFLSDYKTVQFQIEEGSQATPYEPYNGTQLSTTPQITLHGIGDVKDEWDVVNEMVTRRIGKIVLDGSENWKPTGVVYGKEYAVNIPMDNLIPNAVIPTDGSIYLMCDKLKHIGQSIHIVGELTGYVCAYHNNGNFYIRMPASSVNEVKEWLANNKPTLYCKLAIPTTESVRITPQNPQESTTFITLDTALQKVGNVTDQLRWNPYKGHYVRYNYIQDGVASDTYTIENLTSLNERKYVKLYDERTYIDTDHSIESRSHGISIPTIAEQGKQYQIRWDYLEAPSVDTIKVDLCGNVKEIPSTDNSVVIDVDRYTHSFVQFQAEGFTGKITNVMVIETVNGEIPDVDFFSGIQCIGNVVQVDGVNKAEIVVEQTNGNLIDEEFEIYNNGNGLRTKNRFIIRPNKEYIFRTTKTMTIEPYDIYGTRISSSTYGDGKTIVTPKNAKTLNISASTTYSSNGSANIHYPVELCYADMAKDGIRPRYYDKESFILPQKLCRVGEVYDNLYYDDLKGYYRIQQSIGHKYFMGESSELWNMETTNGYRTIKFTCTNANIDMRAMGATICNGWKHLANINTDTEGFIIYNGTFVIRVDNERLSASTIVAFKEYLASNPIHLFYQLKTPVMVDLTQYPKRIELNTYRDEIFTFLKGLNPTRFTLSVPFDKTYRFDDRQEGQGYANRVTITDERISPENVVAIQEVRGQGIANIIEDANNVPVTPQPNYSGKATSHTLNNTKPATINVHGFEASGDTKVGTYNTTDKAYQIKVMSGNDAKSLSDYYVLNLPYQLETYADGTKDKVYYNEAYKEWHFMGGTTKTIEFTSGTGVFAQPLEIFRGLAPRTGMIAEFKLQFDGTSNSSRFYYSLDGVSYSYGSIRNIVANQDIYVAFFNTGGIKLDYATKVGADSTYDNISQIANYIPECLYINQIQTLTSCEVTIDKQYIYSELKAPISLETYDGTTKVYMDGNTTDTNIIMNNDCLKKVVNTYPDVEYTVYWKHLGGDGKLTITLGGTKVEVDGTQEYVTVRTQENGSQELLYVGGYNLSIQDLMVVKGAKIEELAYFENSREVGTLVLDEEGNKSYKITLVQGGSVLEQRDNDTVAFKDDNKHNVVVHKIVGVCPTKVD